MADISKIIYTEPKTETTVEADIKDAAARQDIATQGAILTSVSNSVDDLTDAVDGKAPTSHAVNASTYGLGTTGVYGHVKTVNNVTTSAHADGLALSAYQGKVLKDAIDGKADASHTHSYLPLSGGSVTGDIERKDSRIDLKESDNGTTVDLWPLPFGLRDKNKYAVGGLRMVVQKSGPTRTALDVFNRKSDNTQVEGTFGIQIDKSGNVSYQMTNPSGLKSAIGLSKVVNLDQGDAVKSITRSGTTFTATRLDGTTFTFTQQDNNNTYPKAVKEIGSYYTLGKNGYEIHYEQYDGTDTHFSIGHDSYKVDVAGDTMTGDLSMGTHLIKSSSTLNLQGTSFLNLRSPGIQCRNAADSAWSGISASSFTKQSSKRYKENIHPVTDEIADIVYSLNVKNYDYKENVVEDKDRFNRVGLIAEELDTVIPEVVSHITDENGNEIPDGIDYSALVPYLLKTIQVQHEDIKVLYKVVTELTEIIKGKS